MFETTNEKDLFKTKGATGALKTQHRLWRSTTISVSSASQGCRLDLVTQAKWQYVREKEISGEISTVFSFSRGEEYANGASIDSTNGAVYVFIDV